MSKYRSIGIFGGTFDPIHHGHLRAALDIYQQLGLDEMRLIPCQNPPHRTPPLANASERLTMLRLATSGSELKIDERELHRSGPSYTVDTLMSLRKEFPKASICMVVGVDAFLGLSSWYQWEKIIQLANIVVMHRTQWDFPKTGLMRDFLNQHALQQNEKIADFTNEKIIQCQITALDISGSHIRQLLQTGLSPRYFLPDNVLEYIEKHGLYECQTKLLLSNTTEVSHI